MKPATLVQQEISTSYSCWMRCTLKKTWCENLVFDKRSGELIGFVDLGDINTHLLQYEEN